MNRLSIMSDMGENVPLLTKTDMWLETQRVALAQKFSELCQELRTIQLAQRVKNHLQQTNLVALRCTKYENNEPIDEHIVILPLPDAIEALEDQPEKDRKQMNLWVLDGYDVEESAALRKSS